MLQQVKSVPRTGMGLMVIMTSSKEEQGSGPELSPGSEHLRITKGQGLMSEDRPKAKGVCKRPVRVLFVEDNPADLELSLRELKKADLEVCADLVQSPDEFEERLRTTHYDIVLADYNLSGWTGMDALAFLREKGKDIPFILVTGALGEEMAVECVRKGVSDYIRKDRLARLPVAICRALEEKHLRDERKRGEELLAHLAAIVESSDDAIIGKTLDGIILTWNRAAERLYGYSAEEMKGQPISVLMPRERPNELIAILERLRRGEGIAHYETVRCRKDGRRIDVSLTVSPIKDAAGNIIGASAIARDITQRKQAERQLKKALKEKELLLQEIHHRVKNNLQIVSSLLSIQSRRVQDEQALHAFKESQSRIQSMALIHETLCRSEDFSKIDFAEYVRELAHHLLVSYGINSQAIQLEMDLKDVRLGVDTAVPCGLLITELISNSLTHAFPSRRKGKVQVRLHPTENNRFELTISDNGIGFPREVDFRSARSIGLQLVNKLAEQLQATIEIHTNDGTDFKMTFCERIGKGAETMATAQMGGPGGG